MKGKGLIFALPLVLSACNDKPAEEAAGGSPAKGKHASSALPSAADDGGSAVGSKDGKSSVRSGKPRKPPEASVAAGQPGKVISPFSNEAVDVAGRAPGDLVQDPKFPGDESKKFAVPEGVEEEKNEIKVGLPVPGQPGMVFSPFNNKIVDVRGIPAGRLVADPTYPTSEKKYFRVSESAENPAAPPAGGGAAPGQ
ncbi:hypothetical protein [Luteolibacter sp. Populi]|uniref:hypothetical protein n=1 Tax=Luteolibacter sp. Populi TaxID=3230487 RepID=UPI00346630B0